MRSIDKNILIMCRGNSVNRFSELHGVEFDRCYLVNMWDRELKENINGIGDFIESQKDVVHVVCRDPHSLMTWESYKKYQNISYCQLNTLNGERSNVLTILNEIKMPFNCLPDYMVPVSEDGKGGYPTTGVLAFVLATKDHPDHHVYLIGMDFYESDYFTPYTIYGTHRPQKSQVEKGKRMNRYMKHYLTNPLFDGKVTIITNSSFEVNVKNVEVK